MAKYSFYLLLSLVLMSISASAKPLPRAPMLGLAPASSEPGQAVVAGQVLPGGTAANLGLQNGDQLLALNDQAISDFPQLLEIISALATGDSLSIDIQRGDQQLTLDGRMQARPYETSEIAEVEYASVDYAAGRLRSITHFPKSAARDTPLPAIFYIQGYPCSSIDYGMAPTLVTRQLLDQFVAAGYAVFRVEKPGMGDSQSDKHCLDINFTEENDAFLAGLRTLKQHPRINAEAVYLWGHSLGVLHSPVLAKQESVAGIIGYGGVHKSWYDYMLDIYRVQSVKHFGTDPAEAEQNAQTVEPFLDLWLNSDASWEAIAGAESTQAALESELIPVNGNRVFNRHYSFFRDLNVYDFARLWEQLEVPVLMIYGSLDIQAIGPEWTQSIVDSNQDSRSRALVIEGAEHAFMRYDNQADYRQARESGRFTPSQPGEHFDRRIGEATLDWLSSNAGAR
jgi:hypothetical protein